MHLKLVVGEAFAYGGSGNATNGSRSNREITYCHTCPSAVARMSKIARKAFDAGVTEMTKKGAWGPVPPPAAARRGGVHH